MHGELSVYLDKYRTNVKKRKGEMVLERENIIEAYPYKQSLTHEICNLNAKMIQDNLTCAFYSRKDGMLTDLKYIYTTTYVILLICVILQFFTHTHMHTSVYSFIVK